MNHQVPIDAICCNLLQEVEQTKLGTHKEEQHKYVDEVAVTANVRVNEHQTNDQIEEAFGDEQEHFKRVVLLQ